jgi:sugar-specific transcriptional regulator TrmB
MKEMILQSDTAVSEQTVSALLDFGFTFLQARVYLALLSLGAGRASHVASTAGIVRPEAYRILRELATKGLVQTNLGSPATYTATAPNEALSILLEQAKNKVTILDKKKVPLIKSLSSIHAGTNDTNDQRLSVITGGGNLVVKLNQMMTDAKEECVGIVSRYGLRRFAEDKTAGAMISSKKRGVRVRLITEIDQSNVKLARRLARHFEVRKSHDILFYMVVVDGSEMVFGPAFPVSDREAKNLDERKLDLWTNNPRFVRGMYTMFERLWEVSPTYQY